MTDSGGAMLRAEVIQGQRGQLLAVVHAAHGRRTRGTVVVAPPFAEEMNKSRRMVTLFAKAASDRGFETVVPDLTGTGDSDGEFADARWEIWCDDLARTMRTVESRSGQAPLLLALRTGALLALDVVQSAAARTAGLILWAPILDGQRFMRQFLRLRVAGSMAQAGAAQAQSVSVASLEASLRDGTALEVAGYSLAPELWAAISQLKIQAAPPRSGAVMKWFELAASEPCEISAAAQQSIDAFAREGWNVQPRCMLGAAFWGTAEIAEVTGLVAASADALNAFA
jgi:exosortase A-associated hydrolase 2